MNQPSFFDRRPKSSSAPYVKGSATSACAARALAPKAGQVRAQVIALVMEHPPGLTDEEIESELDRLGLLARPGSGRARRVELVHEGRIADSGRTRIGNCGRPMTIWIPAGSRPITPSPTHPVTPSPQSGRPGHADPLRPQSARAPAGDAAAIATGISQEMPAALAVGGARRDQAGDRCPKCRSTETVDARIHNGQSVRRDCKRCGHFIRFVLWYGKAK